MMQRFWGVTTHLQQHGYQGEPDMVRALRCTVEEVTRGLIDDVKGHLSQAWCGEFWTRHACVAQRVSL